MIGSTIDRKTKTQNAFPFLQAETGIVGLETHTTTLALHHVENVPLIDLIKRLTAAPANLLGMKEGRLGIGLPADFTIFDPNHNWTIKADNLRSKSKNTPFDGHTVKGMAMCTVVGGRHVHSLID